MFEKANQDLGAEKKEEGVPKKWPRVERLVKKDNYHENSMLDLAKAEGEFWKDLAREGVSGKAKEKLADRFSDETLGKMEANKERGIDLLTGLHSRNFFEEELPQLISLEKRRGQDCSFLMIDFDKFKDINDSFGHLVGDRALKEMARMIKDQVRGSDIVYRFGGEEFIVFLPDTPSAMAEELAERIRLAIKEHTMELADEKGEKISLNKTVSIGVAGTDQLEDWDEYGEKDAQKFKDKLTEYSDLAVYASKANNRDQVTVYSPDLKKRTKENNNL